MAQSQPSNYGIPSSFPVKIGAVQQIDVHVLEITGGLQMFNSLSNNSDICNVIIYTYNHIYIYIHRITYIYTYYLQICIDTYTPCLWKIIYLSNWPRSGSKARFRLNLKHPGVATTTAACGHQTLSLRLCRSRGEQNHVPVKTLGFYGFYIGLYEVQIGFMLVLLWIYHDFRWKCHRWKCHMDLCRNGSPSILMASLGTLFPDMRRIPEIDRNYH